MMSKLPAQRATEVESKTGCHPSLPSIPIQAAAGAMARAHRRIKLANQVTLLVNGYTTRYMRARGAKISAKVLSM